MKTLVFHFPKMCCPVEFGRIEKAAAAVDDSLVVVPDYAAREVRISVSNEAPGIEEKISAAFEALGDEYAVRSTDGMSEGRVVFSVPEMDCPVEQAEIESAFRAKGVGGARFNVMKRTVELEDPKDFDAAKEAIESCGYQALPLGASRRAQQVEVDSTPWRKLAVALVIALASEAVELAVEYGLVDSGMHAAGEWASFGLAILAIALAGVGTLKKGFQSILKGTLNMNALMAVAVVGGVLIAAWPEAAMVMVLFEISEAIEGLSMTKARQSIRKLMEVAPEEALVKTEFGYEKSPVEEVGVGAVVRVGPGDRVPLDGRIIKGDTSLDQSMVTGESMPAEKSVGDEVWAGTVNLTSTIEVRVSAPAGQSLTARIIEAVENAQASKSNVQRFVDKFASVYTPIVFAVAVAVAAVPPMFFNGEWGDWIYKALCILVISCPCALVISTPVTIVSSLAAATKCGLLIKGGLYLEQARLIKTVGLDKTGTLTKGEPKVADVHLCSGVGESEALQAAASLAHMNKHPLSEAIYRHASGRGVRILPVEGFTAMPGYGVKGRVNGGEVFLAGRRFIKDRGLLTEELEKVFESASEKGMSATALVDLFGVCAVFTLEDEIKPDASAGLKALEREGINAVLLTGDNEKAAHAIADKLGLENVKAGLLPEDKLSNIRELQKNGVVAMAGDGINDAPALAQADIGIAMGVKGTDSAIEAADVAVMDDRISSIATLVRLSKMAHSVLVQNIVFAIGIKLAFMALAISGHATMWMAVFADTGTCLIVVANGMRMMSAKERLDKAAQV